MNTMWSDFVQSSEELYASRSLRFREDNKDLWLSAMQLIDGMDVLEIGCGGGLFCHRIKQFLPGCSVTGLDRDSGHIEYARRKSAELGLDCAFVAGDALALPFPSNSFDACTSHTVVEHVETTGFLREQYRVLKPGGVISVLSVRTRLNVAPENWKPEDPEERALLEKAWAPSTELDKKMEIGRYEMMESNFPMALDATGFTGVNVNFISVVSYAPDNATTSPELALAQVNENRLSALWSLKKALRRSPGVLSIAEQDRLKNLINMRFDERIRQYEKGQKVWDIATSTVMAVTGVKPDRE